MSRKRKRSEANSYVPRERRNFINLSVDHRMGLEDAREALFISVRWPEGVKCPHCHSDSVTRFSNARKFKCRSCESKFTWSTGTRLHGTHLPAWKWYDIVFSMVVGLNNTSSRETTRRCLTSHRGAWRAQHTVRRAMLGDNLENVKLQGAIALDETLTGGKESGRGRGYRGNKFTTLGAKEDRVGGRVMFRVAKDRRRETILKFFREVTDGQVHTVYTDDHKGYLGIDRILGVKHRVVVHSRKQWKVGNASTNSIEGAWGMWKRIVNGTHHHVSEKYADLYLAELAWRMNHQNDPNRLRELIGLLLSPPPEDVVDRQPLSSPSTNRRPAKTASKGDGEQTLAVASHPESEYYHSGVTYYDGRQSGKSNKYHIDRECRKGSKIQPQNLRPGRGSGTSPCRICCADESAQLEGGSADPIQEVPNGAPEPDYYHSVRVYAPVRGREIERVHHKSNDCIAGSRILEANWRIGKGIGTEPCYLCCGDDIEERSMAA